MVPRFFASIVILAALPVHAQPAARASRATAIPHDRMRGILQGLGVEFTEKAADDAAAFAFQVNGHRVTLLNQVKSMVLSSCVAEHLDLQKAQQWTESHFFTRAQRDENDCFGVLSELRFSGGVTLEFLEEFIRHFCTDVTVFAKFVGGVSEGPASPVGAMAWSQVGQRAMRTAPWRDASSVAGLLRVNGNVSLKYDPAVWKQAEGQFLLVHSSGEGQAVVVAERIAVPLGAVEDIALANAQAVDPNGKVVFRNRRRVNGVDVVILKIEVIEGTVPRVYYGYFYAGEFGTVQVVTSTLKALFAKHEREFLEFLNGFEVSK